jgi:hypothetical protein
MSFCQNDLIHSAILVWLCRQSLNETKPLKFLVFCFFQFRSGLIHLFKQLIFILLHELGRSFFNLVKNSLSGKSPENILLPPFQINCRSFRLDTHVSRRVSVYRFAHFGRKKLRQVIWNGGSNCFFNIHPSDLLFAAVFSNSYTDIWTACIDNYCRSH